MILLMKAFFMRGQWGNLNLMFTNLSIKSYMQRFLQTSHFLMQGQKLLLSQEQNKNK